MIEKNRLKILVGVLCVVLLILTVVVALLIDSRSPDPVFGIFQTEPTTATNETQFPTENTEESLQETVTSAPTKEPQRPTEEADKPTQETGANNPTGESQRPTEEADEPTQGTETTDPTEETHAPPETLPPSVVIPPEKDPESGEQIGVSLPCEVPGYDLIIEKLAPYTGMFVENGSNATVENVAMLLVKNNGSFPVEYTQICVECGQETYLFDISALPVGEKLVVQEKNGKTITDSKADTVSAMIVQRAELDMAEGKVQVTDNGNNTLTVKNLTNKTIPTVRVFYKYYMEDEKLFVGGIAFTVRISRLRAGASVTLQPSHYTSQTSRVVMVLTYDSEV